MREKQIEELAQVIAHSCIDLVESSCGEGECCVSCIATKLHKEGVTIQKWIPVTERLPEKDGWYLCYIRSSAFRGAAYLTILPYDQQGFRTGYVYTDDVTHWMPLPEPPKGE